MAFSGENHSHVMGVAIVNTQLILDRASGLNYSGNSGIICNFNTVGEGKERIACHNCPVEIKIEGLRFVNGLSQGVYPACLTGTAGR